MAERQSLAVGPQLDFQQLMVEAQHRWLRPAEICEILQNYRKFHISPEAPIRPSSGSLFLFDRKVLRYFRKDGHSWRKKKDGKTVKEAHEKLKVGSVDVLHCYYAHGEQNENFQRRTYWLLEPDFMRIVFVHYLEVKGSKTNIGNTRAANGVNLQTNSSSYSSLPTNQSKTSSGHTDSASPTSTLTSLCEDADSDDVHQASSRLQSYIQASNTSSPLMNNIAAVPLASCLMYHGSGKYEGQSLFARVDHTSPVSRDGYSDDDDHTYRIECEKKGDTTSLENTWEQHTTGLETAPNLQIKSLHDLSSAEPPYEQEYMLSGQLYGKNIVRQEFGGHLSSQSDLQIAFGDDSMQLPQWYADQMLNSEYTHDLDAGFFEQLSCESNLQDPLNELCATIGHSKQHGLVSPESSWPASNLDNVTSAEGNENFAFPSRKLLLEGGEGLQKVDSFSRWLSKELGDVEDLHVQSASDLSWLSVECGNVNEESSLCPSLSQDQLFSITDFSPKWAFTDSETEIFIFGTFFKSQPEVAKCNWSCMFGELEVLADVLADGVLSCHVPSHEAGTVPFYVTCSNRVACSELREFEFAEGSIKDVDAKDIYSSCESDMLICCRLERILSLRSGSPPKINSEGSMEIRELITKIMSIKDEEKCYSQERSAENGFSELDIKYQVFQKLIKEKLYSWLLRKVTEEGKGPAFLDDEGQGILHLAAALGYDWAIKPIVAAGVSINFRDVNGWTALHWAALCGREHTVVVLVSLGAAPGLLTDPSPEHPLGRTPADLASANGHKGISGFLAESSLTSHLSTLTMKDTNRDGSTESSGEKVVVTVEEKAATPICDGDAPEVLSLKDSLTAVCNAKQAAARIYQVFRMQSFQRKQLECCFDDYGSPEEQAIALLASKTCKPGHVDLLANAAATQIQKKFRGWTKRKEFLVIRQRVIKIQAHVRGHQVRKQYKPIVWSVGILEKIILRWRRKGSGLRGFRQDKKDLKPQGVTSAEDEYDFLKDGRKQTEERLQKALTRVRSMAQYPEARNQYRRLLTAVEGIRETKACDMDCNILEKKHKGEDDMVDIEPLLDDDVFMSMAFE